MEIKLGKIIAIIAVCALAFGSFSVMGLLQSTERLDSSGIIIRPVTNPIMLPPSTSYTPTPPPPEPVIEIDVYSNIECTNIMTNIEWGEIEAGGDSDVQLYVKNNGDTDILISLDTENWSSQDAENHMNLSWNYNGASLQPGEVRAVVLTLSVSSNCPELSSFGFDIVIIGS
jgi:hypothetical protein